MKGEPAPGEVQLEETGVMGRVCAAQECVLFALPISTRSTGVRIVSASSLSCIKRTYSLLQSDSCCRPTIQGVSFARQLYRIEILHLPGHLYSCHAQGRYNRDTLCINE